LKTRAAAPLAPAAGKAPSPAIAKPAPRSGPNPAWQRIATALPVSEPDDPCEVDANRIADEVLRQATRGTDMAPIRSATTTSGGGAAQTQNLPRSPPDTADSSAVNPARAQQVLERPGRPLDAETRRFFEPRFGRDFGHVRVHDDAESASAARDIAADAFTHRSDIAFGGGRYAPATPNGRRLLAHELAHVVQQRSPAAGLPIARQTWGSAKTTAPPANNVSPGDVFRGRLKSEMALFATAGVIVDWIVAERAGSGGATVTGFTTNQLFAETATMKKIKPQPASAADLLPALQMLEYYGAIAAAGSGRWSIALDPLQPGQSQQDVSRTKFDQNRKDIGAFQQSFEKRFDAKGHPIRQIAQQELLEDAMAAGAAVEWKTQHGAEARLAAVNAELAEFVALRRKGTPIFRVTNDTPARVTVGSNTKVMLQIAGRKTPTPVDEADFDHIEPVSTGTDAAVVARRMAIEGRSKSAERSLYNAQSFHRFATEMVWFLHELAKTSAIKFKAGTYPRHGKFAEYAADMYPTVNVNAAGFYEIKKAEQFVDDINTVAEAGHRIWGKFAWQIVYNDTALQTTINKKYGPRMSSAPHHGPAPDKLHMHLDIRPLNVIADPDTGFGIDSSGRVVLY
jgi:Domain of unknown function (DUF4157)